MFRGFARPSAVLMRTFSPSQSIQVGVSWGEPSFLRVTTVARFFYLRKRPCSSVRPAIGYGG
jgi:hypothetical protein